MAIFNSFLYVYQRVTSPFFSTQSWGKKRLHGISLQGSKPAAPAAEKVEANERYPCYPLFKG